MGDLLDHFRIEGEARLWTRTYWFLHARGATYLGWAGLWAVPAGEISEDEERTYGLVRADAPGPVPCP